MTYSPSFTLPYLLFFRSAEQQNTEYPEQQSNGFNINPRFAVVAVLLLLILIANSLSKDPDQEKPQITPPPKSKSELVTEFAQNFHRYKNSFVHLSAAASTCAADAQSTACELLARAYDEFTGKGYRQPLSVETNIKVRQLMNDGRLFLDVGRKLKSNSREVGRILSTDRIFDLGKEYFINLRNKGLLSLRDIKNIEWILLLQGYTLEQWYKNTGYTDVKSLRPQIEKIPADHLLKELTTTLTTQQQLAVLKFKTIQDLIDFINEYKSNWEVEISERGMGLTQIKDLIDALIESGHEDVLKKYERQ